MILTALLRRSKFQWLPAGVLFTISLSGCYKSYTSSQDTVSMQVMRLTGSSGSFSAWELSSIQ
ncbi:MAG TPA: hypothetical protein VG842_06335, partial [Sediminibacterium sp.]|nr:hypothetical protein [Sediminibacterium sp.]